MTGRSSVGADRSYLQDTKTRSKPWVGDGLIVMRRPGHAELGEPAQVARD